MTVKTVPPGRGLDWIAEGFALFRLSPLVWIASLLIFVCLVALLSLVPLLGAIAAMLAQPVLVGGMLLGCRALERGEELRVGHLFDGFRQNTQALLMVGVLSGGAYWLAGLAAVMAAGGGAGLGALGGLAQQPDLALGGALLGYLLSALVGLALSVPVAMAAWFAPALVVFANVSAPEALRASFSACMRNMLPFLLYGVVALPLSVLALAPFGLGLLVLGPVLVASVYSGYRDIFEA